MFVFAGVFVRQGGNNTVLQRVAMQIPRFRATLQSTDQLTVRVVDFLRQMFVDEKTKQLTVAVRKCLCACVLLVCFRVISQR